MTKHTPGPWIYSKDERYFPRIEFPAARLDDQYLTVNEPTGEVMEIYEANARLIAAAPELLERLSWAIKFIDTYAAKQAGPATPELNKARAAIAKATGAA